MLALAIAFPTPGGAGTYHAAMKEGLFRFGVTESLAVSAAFLMHAICIVPVILLGLVLLRVDRISWKEVVAAARRAADQDLPNPIAVTEFARLRARIAELDEQLATMDRVARDLEARSHEYETRYHEARSELGDIHQSRMWKLWMRYYALRHALGWPLRAQWREATTK